MKTCGEWRYISAILDFGTRWRWVVSFMPQAHCTPGERAHDTNWIGRWVGPKAVFDAVKTKVCCPWRKSTPGRRARSPSLYRLSYPSLKIIRSYQKTLELVLPSSFRRPQWPRGLKHELFCSHERWDRGFESHSRHGFLFVSILCLC
jgi:hypothetical protein